ncbi:MAG: alpha-glucoside transport system substrate-binding protein [Streptosporangiaceae bacterium]|jgi:alpha-glucoside transport system substrate-binding protein|nr:alpha-glucoside transport system substrate-binding protein [Streptosporangiaceae bacterium]
MRHHLKWTAVGAALLVAATGCGSGKKSTSGPSGGGALKGVTLDVYAVWSGQEQANFQKVLDAFHAKTGATVRFTSTGDNLATVLGSKIAGGQAPDVAMIPQQGVLVEYAKKGWVKPLGAEAQQAIGQNYSKIWQDLGTVDGKLYGVYFKAANKSTVWYRTKAFADAGITTPPATWPDFVKAAGTLADSGTAPIAVGGGDGWTLTDWFENVYLSQAGAANYDKLSKHQIKWTDPTVKTALKTLAEIWGKPNYLAGGAAGALADDFPTSVTRTFGDAPKAAMVYEGDFVAVNIAKDTKAKVGTDAKVFPFPTVGAQPPVVGGGDAAAVLKDSPGAQQLVAYLASPEAATIEAKAGGFTSPNKSVDVASYPDDTQRTIAKALVDVGDGFRFDMSDLAPAAFGGTKGAGEWKDLQDFLKTPSDVDGAAAKLEADAAKAFKS